MVVWRVFTRKPKNNQQGVCDTYVDALKNIKRLIETKKYSDNDILGVGVNLHKGNIHD